MQPSDYTLYHLLQSLLQTGSKASREWLQSRRENYKLYPHTDVSRSQIPNLHWPTA
jgi:hypothetical protein